MELKLKKTNKTIFICLPRNNSNKMAALGGEGGHAPPLKIGGWIVFTPPPENIESHPRLQVYNLINDMDIIFFRSGIFQYLNNK